MTSISNMPHIAPVQESPRKRVVALIFVALILAIYKVRTSDPVTVVEPSTRAGLQAPTQAKRETKNLPAEIAAATLTRPEPGSREPLPTQLRSNPFVLQKPLPAASRRAKQAKQSAPPIPVAAAVPYTATVPAALAPALPFTYMGQFADPGLPAKVFLLAGSRLISAARGDIVEGGFKLLEIGPRELVFSHPGSQNALRLPIEGEPL